MLVINDTWQILQEVHIYYFILFSKYSYGFDIIINLFLWMRKQVKKCETTYPKEWTQKGAEPGFQ